MKTEDRKTIKIGSDSGEWSLSLFEELEVSQRTQKPPTEELIQRLNHLVTKPPFCWTNKYKEHLPRL